MGAFCCCCPCGDEFEEYPNSSNSVLRLCISLRVLFLHLFGGYGTTFQRIEGRPVSPPPQGGTSMSSGISTAGQDGFAVDVCHPAPRPAPFDADQRYSRLHRDGLVFRREKSMTHLQEESEALRRNVSSSGLELQDSGKKRNVVESLEVLKSSQSETSEKLYGTKEARGLLYIHPSSEEEDVCPTCLEEYTPENPQITTRCSHHFHLGCIYEWMERSDTCPICGKDMEFCESP
ncbi:hypothetical protein Leryth_017246 [Lithospermum erythrorhizon]|nr:hypothetical protein Leryth_017246 [Lithospermum erythrorhizon]